MVDDTYVVNTWYVYAATASRRNEASEPRCWRILLIHTRLWMPMSVRALGRTILDGNRWKSVNAPSPVQYAFQYALQYAFQYGLVCFLRANRGRAHEKVHRQCFSLRVLLTARAPRWGAPSGTLLRVMTIHDNPRWGTEDMMDDLWAFLYALWLRRLM